MLKLIWHYSYTCYTVSQILSLFYYLLIHLLKYVSFLTNAKCNTLLHLHVLNVTHTYCYLATHTCCNTYMLQDNNFRDYNVEKEVKFELKKVIHNTDFCIIYIVMDILTAYEIWYIIVAL